MFLYELVISLSNRQPKSACMPHSILYYVSGIPQWGPKGDPCSLIREKISTVEFLHPRYCNVCRWFYVQIKLCAKLVWVFNTTNRINKNYGQVETLGCTCVSRAIRESGNQPKKIHPPECSSHISYFNLFEMQWNALRRVIHTTHPKNIAELKQMSRRMVWNHCAVVMCNYN